MVVLARPVCRGAPNRALPPRHPGPFNTSM